ncbi:MAG: glycosyltransferase [Clostridia bacterium]|nr:glycosyltransferase [Clostridia bacterium]
MRILFISECFPDAEHPQYGIFIHQQAQALRELGHTVEVVRPLRNGAPAPVAAEADETFGKVYSLPYRTLRYELLPQWAARRAARDLTALLQKNRYDLVAVHITGDPILLVTVAVCRRLNIPVVAHYHGLNVWEEYTTHHPLRQTYYAARRRRALQHVQGLVGVSGKVTERIRSRIFTVPVQTVYNGVDITHFTEKAPAEDIFHIIGVGNLIEIKGFGYLLDAFARLHEEYPQTHLELVGDGVLRPALEAQAATLGIAEAVTFSGKLPYQQVAERMQHSDLFVMPSFYEALGCVYLEAMGCHLPTIGVAGMGIDEIIIDGENGLLVRPRDSDHLYEKMRFILDNPTDAARMGEAGYATACRFTWSASGQALVQFYEKCVKL